MKNGFFASLTRLTPGALGFFLIFGLDAGAALKITLSAEHVPGQVVVKIKKSGNEFRTQAAVIHALQSRLGENAVLDLKPFQTDSSLATVSLAKDSDLATALEVLNRDPAIAYAEPNTIYHTFDDGMPGEGIPNDPDFGKSWSFNNQGQADAAGQLGTPGSDINVLPLWRDLIRGSRKVLVAVIDTGMDWTHPDLKANLYSNPGETAEGAKPGVDEDGNGFVDDIHGWDFVKNSPNSIDENDHGTHCAGVIGATGNNGVGISGVNWEVSILPIRFLDGQGSGTLQGAVDAIHYAKVMKANIISASWGGNSASKALEEAIQDTTSAGILFVAAAGNDKADNDVAPMYPAGFKIPNIIAVAATDNKDVLASFSNYGEKSVHVAAPGVKIYSTIRKGLYKALSGTSMATPHVAGIAALMLSADETLTADAIKDRLIKTSTPMRSLKKRVVAQGRVNAWNAIHNIVPPPAWETPDESKWRDVPMIIESVHPYLDKSDILFPVKVEGVKYLRVHFEKVDMENTYDFVKVEGEGRVLNSLTGKLDDFTSDYVEGDSLNLRLKSDFGANAWGFRVDRVQVIDR